MIRKINPATLELVGEVPETDLDTVAAMVAKARKAQAEWASWSIDRRVRAIVKVQESIIAHLEDIAHIVAQETGKPRTEAINADILPSLTAADFAARSMRKLFVPRPVRFGNMSLMMRYLGRRSYIQNKPLGVVAIIAPWNYPLAIPFSQTIMAVAAGNAVVLKPSSETPLTGLEIAKLFASNGFPDGLVQVVIGPGSKAGRVIISAPVDRVIFTGHTKVGMGIMEMASQSLVPVTLELGGKDPMVVFEDADLERAAKGAVWGAFVNAGQTCVCVKRIYVQEGAYQRFLALFTERVGRLRLGYGWDDPNIDMGPMINAEALADTEGEVREAVAAGGRVLVGGKRVPGSKGFFFEPTVIADAPHSSKIVQEELFGPVVTVHRFTTEEEAVKLANDSPYALSGSVWTGDPAKGRRVAERLSGGTVVVNNVAYTFGLAMTPWGGKAMSGFGRTHGDLGFSELVEPHHIHVDKAKFGTEIWWHPYEESKLKAGLDMVDLLYVKGLTRKLSAIRKMRAVLKGK
jgi:succinate-semialdehyde dehydrogenase/glutarate-semialdehyde dehydrogenase